MKLSKTQLEVLKKLAEPDSWLLYMGYMGSFNPTDYYFFHTDHQTVRASTVRALKKHGFVETTGQYNNIICKITDTGREFLSQSKGE